MNATDMASRHKLTSFLLSLLLIFSCVPALALSQAKQAWGADDVYAYAFYYSNEDNEPLTLVLQATNTPNPQYGSKYEITPIARSGGTLCGAYTTSYTFIKEKDAQYKHEKELASKVTRVVAQDPITVQGSTALWFDGMSKCTSFDLRKLDLSHVTSTAGMFRNCSAVTTIDFTSCPTSATTKTSEMFKGCSSLQHIIGLETGEVGTIYTKRSFGYKYLDKYTRYYEATYSIFSTGFKSMFEGCSSLQQLDMSKVKAGDCINYSCMFKDCAQLQRIDMAHLTFPHNIVYFDEVFKGCTALKSVSMPHGLTNYTDSLSYLGDQSIFKGAFSGCSSLTSIDLSGIYFYELGSDMNDLFAGCTALQEIAWFGTSKSFGGSDVCPYGDSTAFSGCTALRKVVAPEARMKYFLPKVSNEYIPGASGAWMYENGVFTPVIVENDIQPEWIEAVPPMLYTGSPIQPAVRVIENGTDLQRGKDYAVEYRDNIKPGNATVVISGRGIYTGQVLTRFTILRNPALPDPDEEQEKPGGNELVTIPSDTPNTPTGSPQGSTTGDNVSGQTLNTNSPNTSDIAIASATPGSKPTIRIVVGGRVLVEGVDYRIEYRDADRVGTATAVITGLGPDKWVREVKFEVLPAGTKLKRAALGAKKTKVAWKKQAKQTDGYQVRYSAKKSMKGARTVTVKGAKKTSAKLPKVKLGKRLYAQVRTYKKAADGRTYYSAWSPALCVSNPPATAVSKAKGAKKSLTVKWKKQPKRWTSGYEVRYSPKKSMKGAKAVLVPGAKKSSAKIANLKGGKKYYVQVRTYKKMGKKTYYSPWSAAKSAKTKR